MDLHLKKALFLASLSCLNANERFVDNSDFLAIMPSDKEEENTPQVKLEHKLEQKVAPQNTLKEQEVTPLKSAELLQSQVKREFKEKKKAQKHFKAMQTKNGFFLGSEIAITGTKLTQSLNLISNATDDLITYSHTSSNANFNMGVLMGYQHYFGATKKHGIKFSMHLYGGTPSSITTNIDIYKSKVSSNYTPLNFGLDIKYLFDFLNVSELPNR